MIRDVSTARCELGCEAKKKKKIENVQVMLYDPAANIKKAAKNGRKKEKDFQRKLLYLSKQLNLKLKGDTYQASQLNV